jgi:hypothetical protein
MPPDLRAPLPIYVITHGTTDYGDKFVVREQLIMFPGGELRIAPHPTAVCDSLEEARRVMPSHLVRMQPFPDDDPVIVETWL